MRNSRIHAIRLARRALAAPALAVALWTTGAGVAGAQDQAQSAAAVQMAGNPYQSDSITNVVPTQAQLVVLRQAASPDDLMAAQSAHLYVDGSFNTALMPGMFTRFCVAAGLHTIEAYIGDAPNYAGKREPKTQVNLDGGTTYFVAVAKDGAGELVPYRREDMERQLAQARELRYVINRAASVTPCEGAAPVTAYSLRSDVLFPFGKGDYASLTDRGRDEIRRIGAELMKKNTEGPLKVIVTGHADPIGSDAVNRRLSVQRAAAVRRVLVAVGLPASAVQARGLGSTQPAVACAPGPATRERIDCNAPNRRVEIAAQSAQNRK